MADDIILNKVATIRNCIKRLKEEYCGHEVEFDSNYTKQDSIILNLQRACEASLDLGMRYIRLHQMETPQKSRDVFVILEKNRIITPKVSRELQAMVGFRNIAVHDYQRISLAIVHAILKNHLNDFEQYIEELLLQ